MTNESQLRREGEAFVERLQKIVETPPKSVEALQSKIKKANDMPGTTDRPKVKLTFQSENAKSLGLRTTCPSRSVASAKVPASMNAAAVEFYMTKPRVDGKAETRLLGTAKYKDGDGYWNVTFQTERFSRAPNDPLLVHVEVMDINRRKIASTALAGIA